MLEAKKQWRFPVTKELDMIQLTDELKISRMLAKLLIYHGISDVHKAATFLQGQEESPIHTRHSQQHPDELNIHATCLLSEATIVAIEEMNKRISQIHREEPPQFLMENVEICQVRTTGIDQQNLKCILRQDDLSVEATGYHLGPLASEIAKGVIGDVVGEWVLQEWNGVRRPHFLLHDLRINQTQIFDYRGTKKKKEKLISLLDQESVIICFRKESIIELAECDKDQMIDAREDPIHWIPAKSCISRLFIYDLPYSLDELSFVLQRISKSERIYCLFGSEYQNELAAIPSREQFKWLYAFLFQKRHFLLSGVPRIAKSRGISEGAIHFMIEVFLDLGFVRKQEDGIHILDSPVKQELTTSAVYKRKKQELESETELLYSSYDELCQVLKKDTLHYSSF